MRAAFTKLLKILLHVQGTYSPIFCCMQPATLLPEIELPLSLSAYGEWRRVSRCSVPDVSIHRNDFIFNSKNVEMQDPHSHTLNNVNRSENLTVVYCPKFRILCLARLLHIKLIVVLCLFVLFRVLIVLFRVLIVLFCVYLCCSVY
jgi:hypothetical protein